MNEKEYRYYFVNTAKTYIGTVEGSKQHKDIVNTYNAIKPIPQNYKLKETDSWCAGFVSAMAKKCDLLDIIPAECSCPRQIALWQKMGRWKETDSYKPTAGDIIYYDWDDSGSGDNKGTADHVGIVEKVENGIITVIEGNKNDAVGRRTIAVNGKYIRGFGLPNFKAKAEEDSKMIFKDISKNKLKGEIEEAYELGIVKGYGDGTFKPDAGVTRAEAAAMVLRAFKLLMAEIKKLAEKIEKLGG